MDQTTDTHHHHYHHQCSPKFICINLLEVLCFTKDSLTCRGHSSLVSSVRANNQTGLVKLSLLYLTFARPDFCSIIFAPFRIHFPAWPVPSSVIAIYWESEWPWKCLTISFCYFPIIFQYHQLQTISTCDIGSLQMGSQLRAGFLDLKDGSKRSLMLMCIWKITDRKFLIPTFTDDYTWLCYWYQKLLII